MTTSTITTASGAQELHSQGGTLDQLIWSFAPDEERPAPETFDDLQSITAESKALAKELKKHSFVFVGPTTVYATMQAIGVVNDHLAGCAFR
jgi:DNA-3-methyladenine glycosylase I